MAPQHLQSSFLQIQTLSKPSQHARHSHRVAFILQAPLQQPPTFCPREKKTQHTVETLATLLKQMLATRCCPLKTNDLSLLSSVSAAAMLNSETQQVLSDPMTIPSLLTSKQHQQDPKILKSNLIKFIASIDVS